MTRESQHTIRIQNDGSATTRIYMDDRPIDNDVIGFSASQKPGELPIISLNNLDGFDIEIRGCDVEALEQENIRRRNQFWLSKVQSESASESYEALCELIQKTITAALDQAFHSLAVSLAQAFEPSATRDRPEQDQETH